MPLPRTRYFGVPTEIRIIEVELGVDICPRAFHCMFLLIVYQNILVDDKMTKKLY